LTAADIEHHHASVEAGAAGKGSDFGIS